MLLKDYALEIFDSNGRKIAVNALKDEDKAKKIIEWLVREINDSWE